MGLQHALAMISGIYTVPYVIAKFSMDGVVVTDDGVFAFKNEDLFQYIISAALISCGIMTFFQVMQFRIPFTKLVCWDRPCQCAWHFLHLLAYLRKGDPGNEATVHGVVWFWAG